MVLFSKVPFLCPPSVLLHIPKVPISSSHNNLISQIPCRHSSISINLHLTNGSGIRLHLIASIYTPSLSLSNSIEHPIPVSINNSDSQSEKEKHSKVHKSLRIETGSLDDLLRINWHLIYQFIIESLFHPLYFAMPSAAYIFLFLRTRFS